MKGWRKIWQAITQGSLRLITRSPAGSQNLTPGINTAADINPQGAGTVASDAYDCDIIIQNIGNEVVWINGTGNSGDGYELKPGNDTGGHYHGHKPDDGTLKVVTDSGAGGSSNVQATFLE